MVVLLVIFASISTYLIYEKYYINNKQNQTENNYNIFAQSLKKELSKYDNNNYNYQRVTNEIVPDGYEISINEKGTLYVRYFNKELNDKYGKYKIADNVLSFYVINDGQNFGNMLYFINEDGTVGKASAEYRMNDNISVIKDMGKQNGFDVTGKELDELENKLKSSNSTAEDCAAAFDAFQTSLQNATGPNTLNQVIKNLDTSIEDLEYDMSNGMNFDGRIFLLQIIDNHIVKTS